MVVLRREVTPEVDQDWGDLGTPEPAATPLSYRIVDGLALVESDPPACTDVPSKVESLALRKSSTCLMYFRRLRSSIPSMP